jgi:hypothetical protein
VTIAAALQLEEFLDRFTPEMAALGRSVIERLRCRLPQADALIFDNYNFLGMGFSADGTSSGVFLSLVLYPRWANLFFFKGVLMHDPDGLLDGNGKIIRHVRLDTETDFDLMCLEPLIVQAIDLCEPALDPLRLGKMRVHSIAAKQRPRRPAQQQG